MNFSKGECRILHRGWISPIHQYRMRMTESSLAEKNLGLLVGNKMKKVSSTLAAIGGSMHTGMQ